MARRAARRRGIAWEPNGCVEGLAAKHYRLHRQPEGIPLLQARPTLRGCTDHRATRQRKITRRQLFTAKRRLLRIPTADFNGPIMKIPGSRPGQRWTRGLTKWAGPVMRFFTEPRSPAVELPCEVRRRLIESSFADARTTVFGAMVTGFCGFLFAALDQSKGPAAVGLLALCTIPVRLRLNPGISSLAPHRRPEATLLDRARPDSRRGQHTFLCRISGGRDIPDLE